MSGYAGNPDLESEHAIVLAENGVHAAGIAINGAVLTHCVDCGEEIEAARRSAMIKHRMKCIRCFSCQEDQDSRPVRRIKMLTKML